MFTCDWRDYKVITRVFAFIILCSLFCSALCVGGVCQCHRYQATSLTEDVDLYFARLYANYHGCICFDSSLLPLLLSPLLWFLSLLHPLDYPISCVSLPVIDHITQVTAGVSGFLLLRSPPRHLLLAVGLRRGHNPVIRPRYRSRHPSFPPAHTSATGLYSS